MSAPLNLLLVDDHAAVREGLAGILTKSQPAWQVQQAGSGADALELTARQRFDVGIVDMSMPRMNGLELLAALRQQGQRMPLLMLSMHAEEAYALGAFKAGATGYITKDQAADQLVQAVLTLAGGGLFAAPALMRRLHLDEHGRVAPLAHASLTPRELQVLEQRAQGATSAEAAAALGLPEAAVLSAQQRLFEKLKLGSLEQVLSYAKTHGLLN